METRTILQIVLGVIIVSIVGLGGFIVYNLTKEAETVVVEKVIDAEQPVRVNPWADKGGAAVALVQSGLVTPPLDPEKAKAEEAKNAKKRRRKKAEPEEAPVKVSIKEVMENEEFVRKQLNITGERVGWEFEWWEETKFGPHFFLVRYAFKDGDIHVGPEWLVDLKNGKVSPKNLPALVAEHPAKGMESEYYGKKQQIVSAIASHRFDNKMTLAGSLLLYFEQRSDGAEDDTIVGWTIQHQKGNLFKAFFQWIESGEPTYAEFEFDYDRKALKAVNLQAANIMTVGEQFEKQRVSIMPTTYDPAAKRAALRWIGPSRKQCKTPAARPRCDALAGVLSQTEIIESLEWLLTAQANTVDEFDECKRDRRCGWVPQQKDEKVFNVKYRYKLEEKEQTVSWDIDVKSGEVKPVDRVSKLAFSVIRAR